jgi:hypothetical protein
LISFKLIVTTDVAEPSATTGVVPVIEEFAATAIPEVKTTVPSAFVIGAVSVRTFDSATVDERVHVETPAVVTEQAP